MMGKVSARGSNPDPFISSGMKGSETIENGHRQIRFRSQEGWHASEKGLRLVPQHENTRREVIQCGVAPILDGPLLASTTDAMSVLDWSNKRA